MTWTDPFGESVLAHSVAEQRPREARRAHNRGAGIGPAYRPAEGGRAPALSDRGRARVMRFPRAPQRHLPARWADPWEPSLLAIPPFLRHLYRLTDRMHTEQGTVPFIHAVARPMAPGRPWPLIFEPMPVEGSPPLAYVRDVARAALLALETYEWTNATQALGLARHWLRFVEYTLERHGRFATALRRDGTWIGANAEDPPLAAAHALWALACAWRVTGRRRYARHARRAIWAGSDSMSVLAVQALALMELYEREPSAELRRAICARCERIRASGSDYFRDRAGDTTVALSDYYQLAAVARAGRLFTRLDFLRACESTVATFVEPVVAQGFFHIYPHTPDPLCAADIAPLVLGLEQLQQRIHPAAYRALAFRCIDWLDGNNPAEVPVYERMLGRCADAVQEGEKSPYCGAEAAAEAGFMELARCRLYG